MKKQIILSYFLVVIISSLSLSPLLTLQSSISVPLTSSQNGIQRIDYSAKDSVKVLVETYSSDDSSVSNEIVQQGGKVTHKYKYLNALAAEVPQNILGLLEENPAIKSVTEDRQSSLSASDAAFSPMEKIDQYLEQNLLSGELCDFDSSERAVIGLNSDEVQIILDSMELDTIWNYQSMFATDVWEIGNMGEGSLAVVIDSGIYSDHIMFSHGNVIGGIDISYDVGTMYEGYNNPLNHYHGTHCAGILAGKAAMIVSEDDIYYQSYVEYIGNPVPATSLGYPEGYYIIPLFGMAPEAQLYGVKLFDHVGSWISDSDLINAFEIIIDMHLSGEYDIDIISMSLSGETGFDGRTLVDQIVDYATSLGISVVSSAGNDGPASMTTRSPGTSNTAINVAAAINPLNYRMYWDIRYGFSGIGYNMYPHDEIQMVYYSSRGPTSDGRNSPVITATGMSVLSAINSNPSAFGWVSGTSMATPAVAGAVALLNSWGEQNGASPYDYREALTAGAEWIDGYDEYDQGAGYLNAANSMEHLKNDSSLGDEYPLLKKCYKRRSAKPKGIDTQIIGSGTFTYSFESIRAGRTAEFFFKALKSTDKVKIEISNLDSPNYEMLTLYVQSAARAVEDYYFYSSYIWGDSSFDISDFNTTWTGSTFSWRYQETLLQPGYMKIILMNLPDNFDAISGTITITVESSSCCNCSCCGEQLQIPDEFYFGFSKTGDVDEFTIGTGAFGVKLELWWFRDWTHYPTSNLDLVVSWYDGVDWYTDESGKSFRSPEGVYLIFPDIQEIHVTISGFETYGLYEPWLLTVTYIDQIV